MSELCQDFVVFHACWALHEWLRLWTRKIKGL